MFGKLTLEDFIHGPIEMGASISMILAALFIIGLITYKKSWKWLWNEWFTSLDPKKIGVMYLTVAIVMLVKGLTDAGMMRVQQAMAAGDSYGHLSATPFQQIVTAHDDLFCGNGSNLWPYKLNHATTNWCSRRSFSLFKLAEFLALYGRGIFSKPVVSPRRIFGNGLGLLPSPVRYCI